MILRSGKIDLSPFFCRQPVEAPVSEPDMDLASGIAAFEAKEFRRALQLLTPLAEQGNADAQFRLAIMCQNGLGRVANAAQALHWMHASASQGHGLALHGLGVMYLYGECVDKDESEALKYFQRVADQGLAGSLTTLAMMYREGMGVEKDPVRAQALYRQAGFET